MGVDCRTEPGPRLVTIATVRPACGHWSSALDLFSLFSMKRAAFFLLTAAVALAALSATRSASALGPVDVEVAAKVGGGTSPENSQWAPCALCSLAQLPNALGVGLGVRAGVSFVGFYGGLSFMDYLGSQATDAGPLTESLRSVLYGVEVGYNISVPLLTLRPQLGIGNYTVSGGYSGRPPRRAGGPPYGYPAHFSDSNLYLEPGVTGLLSFCMWIVGADANVLLLTGMSGSQPAFTAHGQVGIKF
jgi:hypothetical protein